jgi:pyruvate dehydrogenase E2 component (dihydrolipoamide acetyltransferase)
MKHYVTMPSLGADMESGKLVEWKIKPGDWVKKGQAIALVETQKANVEIESFREGTVLELQAQEGNSYDVGASIALMEVTGDAVLPAPPELRSEPDIPPPLKALPPERMKISPAARRLAEKEGIGVESLHPSGGVIELKDVELALTKRGGTSSIRDAIARQMSKSKREIPHYYLTQRIGLDRLINWVDTANVGRSPEDRIFIPALLMKAVVSALKSCPDLNGVYLNGRFQPSASIHLGLAVALKSGGVMVPAILDAQALTLQEMNHALKDITERTRKGGLKNREMTEGTITVTNVGDLGAHGVVGVIFPPQVAIVGLGRIRKEAVVDGQNLRPGFVLDVSLSADHRVTDGITGSRFLNKLERLIASPGAEWTE